MLRILEDLPPRAVSTKRPIYIDRYRWLICSTTCHVVRNKQVGDAGLVLDVLQEIEHLSLD